MAAGMHYELRVGILFTLYTIYGTQPEAHQRVRISINQGLDGRCFGSDRSILRC